MVEQRRSCPLPPCNADAAKAWCMVDRRTEGLNDRMERKCTV